MNSKLFTKAMSNFVTGVTVVTARDKDRNYGITINSFNSVSLNPPMILYSIGKNTERFKIFHDAKEFVVNILDEKSDHISSSFAKSSRENWEHFFTQDLKIQGAICSIYCRTYHRYEGGDHMIIVALVEDFSQISYNRPLIYYKSTYGNVKE